MSLLALLAALSGPGFAQEVTAQQQEAVTFYERVVKTTDNPLIAAMAKDSLARLKHQEQPRQSVEIPLLIRMNKSLAIPVALNQNTMGTFLIDTGATHTVITPRMANKLGIQIDENTTRLTILTANGTVKAPLVNVKEITMGGITVRNVQAIVQPLGNDILLAGLLGMNVFQDMDLTVKRDKLVLGVRPQD